MKGQIPVDWKIPKDYHRTFILEIGASKQLIEVSAEFGLVVLHSGVDFKRSWIGFRKPSNRSARSWAFERGCERPG